jgi:hypothetical protein
VHKEHSSPALSPGHPIISGCVSFIENLSLFVDHHAKHLVQEIPSYLQDTANFLCQTEELNTMTLPESTFLVLIYMVGFYSNIPNDESLECFKEEPSILKVLHIH